MFEVLVPGSEFSLVGAAAAVDAFKEVTAAICRKRGRRLDVYDPPREGGDGVPRVTIYTDGKTGEDGTFEVWTDSKDILHVKYTPSTTSGLSGRGAAVPFYVHMTSHAAALKKKTGRT